MIARYEDLDSPLVCTENGCGTGTAGESVHGTQAAQSVPQVFDSATVVGPGKAANGPL